MKRQADKEHVHGTRSAAQLTLKTWPDFEKLFAPDSGSWRGCWCMSFQRRGNWSSFTGTQNQKAKHALVKARKTHGTIVYCGKEPIGWCQFGPLPELPRIGRRRGYVPTGENPWMITCLRVKPSHRKMGFAKYAVDESVDEMKRLGAKTIEAYPYEGMFSASFMWGGTAHMFEEAGFSRARRLFKKMWIYSLKV